MVCGTNGFGLMAGKGGPDFGVNGFPARTVPVPYESLGAGARNGWASVLNTPSTNVLAAVRVSNRVFLTFIKTDVFGVIESKIAITMHQILLFFFAPRWKTYRYFRTSANQKLSVSSILLDLTLLTSLSPAKPLGVDKNLLKLATALAARSRYLLSPVIR